MATLVDDLEIEVLAIVMHSELSSGTTEELLAIGWSVRNKVARKGFRSISEYLAGSRDAARNRTGHGKQGAIIPGTKRARQYATSRPPRSQKAWTKFKALAQKILTDPQSRSPIGRADTMFEPRLQDNLWCQGKIKRNAGMIERRWTSGGSTVAYMNVGRYRYYIKKKFLTDAANFQPPPLPRGRLVLQGQAAVQRARLSEVSTPEPAPEAEDRLDALRASRGNITESELRAACSVGSASPIDPPTVMEVGAPLRLGFRELKDQIYFCDFRIFIAGIDVTRYVTSPPSVKYGLGGDSNTLSFELQNSGVEVLRRNSYSKRENPWILSHRNIINPEGSGWRRASGRDADYSEAAKFAMFTRKRNSPQNQPDPVVGAIDLVNARGGGVGNSAGVRAWPFHLDRPIFHKHDSVVAWVHVPTYDPGRGDEEERWLPMFTGFVDSYPWSEDLVTGESTIQMSCYDIREIMKRMRVLVNPTALQASEEIDYERNSFLTEGLYRDISLIPSTGDGGPLAGQSMEQILAYTLTGTVLERLQGTQSAFNPIAAQPSGGDLIYEGPSPSGLGVGVGDLRLGHVNGRIGVVPLPAKREDRSQFLAQWHSISMCGSYLHDKKGTRGWYTTKEIEEISTHSNLALDPERSARWNPTARRVYILVPTQGTPMAGLYESSANYANAATAEWQQRFQLIDDTLEKLGGYTWFVSPFGDIFIEPPLMDFTPSDFSYGRRGRRGFREHFTIDKHALRFSIDEEQGNIPTGLKVTGPISDNVEINASTNQHVARAFTECTYIVKNLARRLGLNIHQQSFPWLTGTSLQSSTDGPITEQELRLQRLQWGLLELQKRLAKAAVLDISLAYRPFLLPNRPIHFPVRNRFARTTGVTHTLSFNGECSTTIATDYMLSLRFPERSDGTILSNTPVADHITGFGAMPMSFRLPNIDVERAGMLVACLEDQVLREGFTDRAANTVQRIIQGAFSESGGEGKLQLLTREDLPGVFDVAVHGAQGVQNLGIESLVEERISQDGALTKVPVDAGTNVGAITPGTVYVTPEGDGWLVTVQTAGRDIIYRNIRTPLVASNDRVNAGQAVGEAGDGGVYIEALDRGQPVNALAAAEIMLNETGTVVRQPDDVSTSASNPNPQTRPSVPLLEL